MSVRTKGVQKDIVSAIEYELNRSRDRERPLTRLHLRDAIEMTRAARQRDVPENMIGRGWANSIASDTSKVIFSRNSRSRGDHALVKIRAAQDLGLPIAIFEAARGIRVRRMQHRIIGTIKDELNEASRSQNSPLTRTYLRDAIQATQAAMKLGVSKEKIGRAWAKSSQLDISTTRRPDNAIVKIDIAKELRLPIESLEARRRLDAVRTALQNIASRALDVAGTAWRNTAGRALKKIRGKAEIGSEVTSLPEATETAPKIEGEEDVTPIAGTGA